MKKFMSILAAFALLTVVTGCKKSNKDENKPVKKEHMKKEHMKKDDKKKKSVKKDMHGKKSHDAKKKSSY